MSVKMRCADGVPRHLSLTKLEHGDCRYPYGGDEKGEISTFCGHPRRPSSHYCSPHFHLNRKPIALPDQACFAMTGRQREEGGREYAAFRL